MKKKRFKIHPLFIPCVLFFCLAGRWQALVCSLLALALHEYAHCLSAKGRGYALTSLSLTPYGAALSAESGLPDKDAFFVCAAGPLANLSIALVTVALWWIAPSSYFFTLEFLRANLALGVFNLLPVYPLDGGRMIISVAKNKSRCIRILKILGFSLAAISLALFVVSAFYKIAYPLFLVAVILIFGILNESKEEKYVLLRSRMFFLKDSSRPWTKRELFVLPSLKIKRLLRALKNDEIYTVYVLDEQHRITRVLSEADLEKMFLFDTERSIGEFSETLI